MCIRDSFTAAQTTLIQATVFGMFHVAPGLFLLSKEHADRLGAYVRGGGHLVVGPFSAVEDNNGHLAPGRFPGVLADLLGVDGEEWVPLASPVVYVRQGAVLPLGTVTDRPEYDWATDMEFHAFAAGEGQQRTVAVPTPDGAFARFEVTVSGGQAVAVAL